MKTLFYTFVILLFCAWAQAANQDDEIRKYEAEAEEKPNDAKVHKELGIAYARNGDIEKAIGAFDKAMDLEYKRGYENGIRREGVKFYGRYLILSIAIGLIIAAIIVSILSWSEITDKLKKGRENARVRAFIRSTNVKLEPELKKRATEIAQSKEKLLDAINRESDSSIREAASGVVPKLDDLAKQASLLLQLQQNLSDYIKDVDPAKLQFAQRNCEEKLRKETDQEAKRALEYELKQIRNKQANYSKANAKIRTCDAVLSGIAARIDATSLDLMSLPSVLLKKQEFFEKVSADLDEEINLTRDAAETVMDESSS